MEKIKRKIIGKGYIRPWMNEWEMLIIEDILKNNTPNICLEWGAGFSTIYYPKFLPNTSQWIAIEHEKTWCDKVRLMNSRVMTQIIHKPPNQYPWTDKDSDGSYEDLKDYIEFPKEMPHQFDFILIDGRGRKYCVDQAAEISSLKGLVVLHDAHRENYHESLKQYRYQLLLADNRVPCGIWIGTKSAEVNNNILKKRYDRIFKVSLAYYNKIKMCVRIIHRIFKS